MIAVVRDVLLSLGVPYVIENVLGARSELREPVELWGQLFGLTTDRARLFTLVIKAVHPSMAIEIVIPLGTPGPTSAVRYSPPHLVANSET